MNTKKHNGVRIPFTNYYITLGDPMFSNLVIDSHTQPKCCKKVEPFSLKQTPGKGKKCQACDGNSATMIKIVIKNITIEICPFCNGSLENLLNHYSKLFDGY